MPALKMVAVDMDGTFLNASGRLSERNQTLIAWLHQRGVHFAVATGRPAAALQPFIDQMGVASLPAVTFNGALLQHARAGLPSTPLWQQTLDWSLAQEIVELVDSKLGLPISFSTRTRAVFLARNSRHREQLATYESLEGVPQDAVVSDVRKVFDEAAGSPPLKIVGLSFQPEADAASARAALAGRPVHVIAAEMHIEFVDESVNKAVALSRLCATLGVPMGSVLAFGDGNNDCEMLAAVGHGVAMPNGKAAAKEAANETCAWSNDDDGVARTCEALMAQGRL